MSKRININVVAGSEGPSLMVESDDGTGCRVAGPKPWGGGEILYTWEVDVDDLIKIIQNNSYER